VNRGDLVWIPSDITLLQFKDGGTEINRFTKLKKPNNVLLMEKGETYYKIIYQGENWHALKTDVYGAA